MSGLDEEQLGELEYRVAGLLEEPWDKRDGRPRELTLQEALVVTCGYMRQNIIEERMGRHLRRRPVDDIAVHHVPHAICRESNRKPPAGGRRRGRGHQGSIALVDGTLWPCWSSDGQRKLWSGKYKTTGHGSLIVTTLQGRITFVSDPVTGNRHDMAKLEGSDVEKILKKAGGVFGDKGFIGTDYITTPDPQAAMPRALAMGTRVEQ